MAILTRLSRRARRIVGAVAVLIAFLAMGGWLRGRDQWGPFEGQFVDADTGAPIANVNVMVEWRSTRFGMVETLSEFFDARETVTDARGRFELPRLWRLWTWDVTEPTVSHFAAGYARDREDVAPAGGTRFIDPTVARMRRHKTPRETCDGITFGGPPVSVPGSKIPNLRRAYESALDECGKRQTAESPKAESAQ